MSRMESIWEIHNKNPNCDLRYSNNINIELRLFESNTPNPSSIAKKFGLGKFDTLINDVLMANNYHHHKQYEHLYFCHLYVIRL